MANPNPGGNVYKRNTPEDLHQAWNAVIRKVNDERADPPSDTSCEALGSIDEVEEDHIWTKQDVEDLRDAIDEMCAFSWSEDLTIWRDSIITEIEAALDRDWGGWGDEEECCHEECMPDCDNALGLVETYIGSFIVNGCYIGADPNLCTFFDRYAVNDEGALAYFATEAWVSDSLELCYIIDEVEALEGELEDLEAELTALEGIRDIECAKPPPNNCVAAQAAVDAKQDEVDAKQVQLDAKILERDAQQAIVNSDLALANEKGENSMAMADALVPLLCQLFYTTLVGTAPQTNITCDERYPACLGVDILRTFRRCRVYWIVEVQTHTYTDWGGEWTTSWFPTMFGYYTPSGQPYITRLAPGALVGDCAGVPHYMCYDPWPPPPAPCGEGCGRWMELEVRFRRYYPEPTPEGEVCCD